MLANLAFACVLSFGLSACPDDKTDPADVEGDAEVLPDGRSCEANSVIRCFGAVSKEAEFCDETGMASFVADCPGSQQCADGECRALPDGAICFPGSVKECVIEGSREAVICNNSGTAYIEGLCTGADGQDSICSAGACSVCTPFTRRCDPTNEQVTQECVADGSGYEVYQTCNGFDEICTGQFCEQICAANIKFKSYIGCDYWGVDLDNAFVPGGNEGFFDAQGAQYAIVVANPPDAILGALVEINQLEGGVKEPVPFDSNGDPLPLEPLLPGELRVYRLPRRDVNGTVQAPLAYQVSSSVPIIAYQFNPLENENVFSNDASLLLPSTLLGQEYVAMTREQTFDILRGYVTVVAVQEGETTVSVQVTASTEAGTIYPGSDDEAVIPNMQNGDTRIFTMQQFDVLNIETDRPGEDLTGTRVLANKRVAVFGGSEAANAPNTARCVDIDPITGDGRCEYDMASSCRSLSDCLGFNTCCADHLEQQMFPVKVWGSAYIATKSWDRGLEKDIWRIIAAENNTRVVLVPPQQGVQIPLLNRGEWFEFESSGNFEIIAQDSKPIMVGQFLAAQDAPDPIATAGDAGTGDPAFILAVPVQQYRTDYVILVPAEYESNYVNITVKSGATVALNGEDILPGLFEPIGSGEYSVYRQRLPEPGAQTITSSEPAGVIVYGYDQYVSYGYTGGLTLDEINKETVLGADQ
ncbi:MAG: hypothetical protein ACI9MR_000258 [Myxococcota bacterium]|jgi:hypothetical protein